MEKKKKLTTSPRLNVLLYNMGIFSEYDVISHLPRRYENYNVTVKDQFEDKEKVVIFGKVVSPVKLVKARNIYLVTFEFMSDKNRYFKIVAFNRQYLTKVINLNEEYTIIGTFDKKNNEINFINFNKGRIAKEEALKPIYALPSDYPNHSFARLVNKSLNSLKGHIGSLVPYHYRQKYRLINKEEALFKAHQPHSFEDIHQSYRYLKYEEALSFSLKNQLIREENKSLKKIKKEAIDLSSCSEFIQQIPYKLTLDQEKACQEIIEDMNHFSLMYRLLQGDVGTGKTLVSFIALYANFKRGDQGALMAPTDVLARQHYKNALELFKNSKIKIALLVGSTPLKEKKQIYQDLMDGYIDIVIGTHALFTDTVKYSSLGLVIIDEQHRFGVNQRQALLDKGQHADLLMMSATPIPRTLALSIYGDLEISTLYTFPHKHRDITTKIVKSDSDEIFKKCEESLANDKKVYVVAPLIDFQGDERYSAEQLYARYVLKFGNKVALLHGKLKSIEKEQILENFVNGDIDILVSTQVIEVGIDVKNANLMIIYDANNFGLAALHQLRGRIGRNSLHADCLLTYDQDDEEALERLQILVDSNDGFAIAEKDLSLRGPGELTGIRQSGLPDFRYLNIVDDLKIFIVARDDASEILKNKDNPDYKWIIDKCKKDIEYSPHIKA